MDTHQWHPVYNQLTGTVLALGEVFLILGKDGGVYCNDETEGD